ncbi:hypothetical protein GCM10027256_05290 [Novispirillum itersonii subsp. nipponicum]
MLTTAGAVRLTTGAKLSAISPRDCGGCFSVAIAPGTDTAAKTAARASPANPRAVVADMRR